MSKSKLVTEMTSLALFSSTFFCFSHARHFLLETSNSKETNKFGLDYEGISGCENVKQNFLVSCAKKGWFIFQWCQWEKFSFCRKISSANCLQQRISHIKTESDCQKEVCKLKNREI